MGIPKPEPGLVISYYYLWRHQYNRGEDSGRKPRPCVIVSAKARADARFDVSVMPITTAEPQNMEIALELPLPVKRKLGLDKRKSWIIANEFNRFIWSGPDLSLILGTEKFEYGYIPSPLFHALQAKIKIFLAQKRIAATDRN